MDTLKLITNNANKVAVQRNAPFFKWRNSLFYTIIIVTKVNVNNGK